MELTRRSFVTAAGLGLAAVAFKGAFVHESGDIMFGGSAGGAGDSTDQVIVSLPRSHEPVYGFDPLKGWGWAGGVLHSPLIQSTLVAFRPDGLIDPDLASEYYCSPDGLEWIFELRQDALFSDGSRLLASDVAFTLNEILKSEEGASFLSPIEGVVALGDHCLRIDLERPHINVLYALAAVGIVPASLYSDNYGLHPVGSGRYELVKWLDGQLVIMSENPFYYGLASDMKTIVVAFQDDDESLRHARSKDLDVAHLGLRQSCGTGGDSELPNARQIEDFAPEDFKSVSLKSGFTVGISMPTDYPFEGDFEPWMGDREGLCLIGNFVTSDKAIRQAINCGVDRGLLLEKLIVANGDSSDVVGVGPVGRRSSRDSEDASRILDEAGWIRGADGLRVKNGQTATFRLYYPKGDSLLGNVAREFAAQMLGLGIDVSVASAKRDALNAMASSNPVLWTVNAGSPEILLDVYHSEGAMNYPRFKSRIIDGAFDKALSSSSVEEAMVVYQSLESEIFTAAPEGLGESPWIWLLSEKEVYYCIDTLDISLSEIRNGYGWSLLESVHKWKWRS